MFKLKHNFFFYSQTNQLKKNNHIKKTKENTKGKNKGEKNKGKKFFFSKEMLIGPMFQNRKS